MNRALLLILLAAAPPLSARADVLTLRDGDTLLSTTDLTTWLDRARCLCGEALGVTVDLSAVAVGSEVALVAGKSCITSEQRISESCRTLWSGTRASGTTTRQLDAAADAIAGGCSGADTDVTLSLLVDEADADQWTSAVALTIHVDTARPAAPTGGTLVAGEKLIEVAFEAADDEDDDEVLRYQVLCTRGGVAGKEDPPEAAFDGAWDRCALDGEDEELVAAHACADAEEGTASVTVTGLTDGLTYEVSVVAIDASGNPSTRRVIGRATPAAEEDLWERYLRSGGAADGSGCQAVRGAGLDALLVVVAAALALARGRARA